MRFILLKLVLAFILVSALVGCEKQVVETEVETEIPAQPMEESVTLTQDYLVSTEWGQEEGPLGSYIEFNSDGTYLEGFAGEGIRPYRWVKNN